MTPSWPFSWCLAAFRFASTKLAVRKHTVENRRKRSTINVGRFHPFVGHKGP
jgi:hypothetical protein